MGLVYHRFSPLSVLPGWCWFGAYPENCEEFDNVECRRDDMPIGLYFLVGDAFHFGYLFVVIFVSMVLIVLKVRDTERRIQQYAGAANQNFERTREVGVQALLYIAAFILTFLPIACAQVPGSSSTKCFVFALMVKTISTMQGFFNAFIFLRKRFRELTCEGSRCTFSVIFPAFKRVLADIQIEKRLYQRHHRFKTFLRMLQEKTRRTTRKTRKVKMTETTLIAMMIILRTVGDNSKQKNEGEKEIHIIYYFTTKYDNCHIFIVFST